MKLHATGRDLLIKESERLISGSIKIYECEFTFDESWDGYTVTAVFSTNGSRLINMAVVDGKCEIPSEVLRPNARIRIGVFGIDGDRRRPTTYSEWITVEQGVDLGGGSAQPPTPSVYEQWLRGLDEKQEEWNGYEEARAEAEAARVEAENARVEAEEAREAQETGYVAQAESWAKEAEDQAKEAKSWADKAQEVVGGDYATKAQAQGYANAAESNANTYTDEQIAAIPPDAFIAEYGVTTNAEIREEYLAGKPVFCKYNGGLAVLSRCLPNGSYFSYPLTNKYIMVMSNGLWSEMDMLTPETIGAYTKGETLADSTKTAFGLGSGAVPDDVFGMFVQHCWNRRYLIREVSVEETPVTGDFEIGYFTSLSSGATITFTAGDSYSIINTDIRDPAEPTLEVAGTTTTVSPNGISTITSTQEALSGKYTLLTTGVNAGTFCYIPENATFTRDKTTQTFRVDSAIVLTVSYTLDERNEWERLFSVDSEAYPTGETEDGWEYIYCGIPFDNSLRQAAQIVVGSYVGTGVYGRDNPCALTFDFAPKVVMVFSGALPAYAEYNGQYHEEVAFTIAMDALTTGYTMIIRGATSDETYAKKSADGKILTWYNTYGASLGAQNNASGKTYYYVAIG